MTIIYFILILGITVFVHEFGHFIFAKKSGVYVYEFSIGMGPRIFKWKRKNDETEYSIRLLPIGGFVQMAGEEVEADENVPKEKRLQSKTIGQRAMIMSAGVLMNFVLALVVLFIVALINGVSLDSTRISESFVDNVNKGDKIIEVDGHFVNNYDKLALELTASADKNFILTLEDEDKNRKEVTIDPIAVGSSGLLYGYDYGFKVSDLNITESDISEIQKGDVIVSINSKDVTSYMDLLKNLPTKKFNLIIKKEDGSLKEFEISPKKIDDDILSGYTYGFYIGGTEEKGIIAAIKYAFVKFFSTIEQMIFTFVYLFTGRLSVDLLSGPVGIFNAVGEYSKYGFVSLLSLLCLIDINVGFINILPLPAFDGGHLLFLLIEKIKGSPLNPKVENIIHSIGFILLMILMIYITYNDIIRIF